MSNPFISVIIPTYNQGEYILEAVKSVLSQTPHLLEVIVIDDNSTDHTREALETLNASNVQYYHQNHLGAGVARNTGVERAQGEWIAFLDADDLWLPQKITLQLACAEDNNSSIIFSHIKQFISPELCVGKLAEITIKNKVMPGYCASTLLIRKKIFNEIGWFNSVYRLGEFMAWYMRLQKSGIPYYLMDDILVLRRIHRNNTSSRNKMARHDYLRVVYEAHNG